MQNDIYELCKVCGDRASNCVYYGGRCCPCCRQFFRRSVVAFSRSQNQTYTCICKEKCSDHENTLCTIKKETRSVSCKYCRFQKCLKLAGLNPKYVVAQYIPKVEKRKSSKNKSTPNSLNSDALDSKHKGNESILYQSSQIVSIAQEMSMKPNVCDIQIATELSRKFDQDLSSVSVGEKVIRQKIMASMFGIPLSPECHIQACRVMMQRIVKVAQGHTAFASLPLNNQNMLLKNNSMLIFSLRLVFMEQRKQGMEQLTNSLSPHDCEITRKLINDIKSSPDNISKLRKIDYKTRMARFGITDRKLLERHKLLETRVGQRLCLNPLMMSLMSYILLFSTDVDGQKDSSNEWDRIEKTQETLVLILQRYIYATCPPSMSYLQFSKIMESLIDLRELCNIINNTTL